MKLKAWASRLYWKMNRYAAEGLTGALRETYMMNSRILALVLGLDLENETE